MRARVKLLLGACAALALSALTALVASAALNPTSPTYGAARLVSVTGMSLDGTNSSGVNQPASEPDVSATGRYVTFSTMERIMPLDSYNTQDILLRDQQTSKVEQVNVTSAGERILSNDGARMSADGQVLVFDGQLSASSSVTGIWVRDRRANTATQIVKTTAGELPTGNSTQPDISADGRYVVFTSYAPNLVAGDTGTSADVFLFDRDAGTLRRVSTKADGSACGGGSAGSEPHVSDDGRYVAFVSIGDCAGSSVSQVMVKDMSSGELTAVSTSASGALSGTASSAPQLSGDGQWVAFTSTSALTDDAPARAVYLRRRDDRASIKVISGPAADTPTRLGTVRETLDISADGGQVVYGFTPSSNTSGYGDLHVYDRAHNSSQRVSDAPSGPVANARSGLQAAISADGHSVVFRSGDLLAAQDKSTVEDIYMVSKDVDGPDTSITSAPSGTYASSGPYNFAFASPESDVGYQCDFGSANWVACDEQTQSTVSNGSPVAIRVRAVDSVGNVDPTPAEHRDLNVDTVGPTVTSLTRPAGTSTSRTVTWTFAASEPATFECQPGSAAAWQPCSSPYAATFPADGTQIFRIRATDALGNLGPQRQVTVPIDTVAPQVTLTGPEGLVRDASVSYAFTVTGATSTVCVIDGQSTSSCTSPQNLQLPDGEHTIVVRASDAAGNVTEKSKTVTVDTKAPQVSLDGPQGPSRDASPQMTFAADEDEVSFQCKLDSADWASCTSPQNLQLPDGEHTFAVRATDAAGNLSAPQERTVQVDTAAPKVTLAGPEGDSADASPIYAFEVDDLTATIECKVDDGQWTACTSPHQVTLPDGKHTITVRARDRAGNTDSASRTVRIDTSAPQTLKISGPEGQITDPSPQITFESDEVGVRFECRVDTDPWTACTSPWQARRTGTSQLRAAAADADALEPGDHVAAVRAIDAAGNVSAEQTWMFTVAAPASGASPSAETQITATIGEELSVSTSDPASMELTHARAGESATSVDVTSTALNWTLSIQDAATTSSGHMRGDAGTLSRPLQVRSDAAEPFAALTASAQPLAGGSLVQRGLPLSFRQALASDEDVFSGDSYTLTALVSATAS